MTPAAMRPADGDCRDPGALRRRPQAEGGGASSPLLWGGQASGG